MLALGTGHVQLGRVVARRQRVEHRARVGRAREDLEQPRCGVGRVVEAVPALAEEEMPAHLAGQRRTGLAQLGLHERVPGLPHQRHAAGLADRHRQALAALDVVDDRRPGVAREDVACEEHDLPVRPDHVPIPGQYAQAVAVAIEGQAEFGARRLDDELEVLQVFGLARVGMVVREIAVDLRVQVDHLAAERTQDCRGARAGDAVAGVDDDPHRPRQPAVRGDAVRVLGDDVHRRDAPLAARVVLALDALAQPLDLLAVDRAAGEHHLEAVVVLGVVAAGDLDAARAAMSAARRGDVIEHRRRHHAEVDDVEPGRRQPPDQRRRKARPRDAAVAPDGHRLLPLGDRFRSEGAAQVLGECLVDGLTDHAADVVSLEDGSLGLHGIRARARARGRCGAF